MTVECFQIISSCFLAAENHVLFSCSLFASITLDVVSSFLQHNVSWEYYIQLVLRILDFPLCKHENYSQTVITCRLLCVSHICISHLTLGLESATMANKGEPQEGGLGLRQEDLPQMDGSCDACEPDEAQPATQVCHTCSFAFCSVHADRHGSSTHHPLVPYNHEGTQANGLGSKRDPGVGNGAKDEARMEGAALMDVDDGEEQQGEAERGSGSKNGQPLASELGDGANGAEAEEEAMAAGETGKREFVTVERLRCKEHGEEGSLYCKTDEKIICVVCAVRGDHREHEIITLHEAYIWQKVSQNI